MSGHVEESGVSTGRAPATDLAGHSRLSLPFGLDLAVSREDGRARLRHLMRHLDDGAVGQLSALAVAVAGVDAPAQEDLADWAAYAAALRAWHGIVFVPAGDRGEIVARIRATDCDDTFFDVGIEMVREGLGSPPTPETDAMVEGARFVMEAAARDQCPGHRARLAYANGIALMWPQVRAAQSGGIRDEEVLAAAGAEFEVCAQTEQAPLALRVEALADLAWIAGRASPAEVARYQTRSEDLQRFAPDRDLDSLRTVRRDLAWWAAQRADTAGVLRLHEANLSDMERELFPAKTWNAATLVTEDSAVDYAAALSAALRMRLDERVVELAEDGKARAFTHALSVLAVRKPTSPFLVARDRLIGTQLDDIGAQLAAAEAGEAREALWRRLSVLVEAYGRNQQRMTGAIVGRDLTLLPRPSVDRIRRALPPGVAYLSYHWTAGRVVIAVVDADGLRAAPVTVAVELDESGGDLVARHAGNVWMTIQLRGHYRTLEALQRDADQRLEMFWPDQFLTFLHGRLIAPVADQLRPGETLLISPHGCLRGLPMHALMDPSGRPLVQDHPVAYTAGSRFLLATRSRRGTGRGAFVAATSPSHGGPAGASAEAAAVAALLGSARHPATREALLTAGVKAQAVHLAAHTDARSLMSSAQGLALDDGTVTGNDIRAGTFRAQIVILSACSTAAMDVDPRLTDTEMNGLVGAFVQAGVPLVAATLWPLPDRVAGKLMTELYAGLLEHLTPARALQRAQLAVRADAAHPYYWAPLTLWGDAVSPIDDLSS
jgi:CHAT domain